MGWGTKADAKKQKLENLRGRLLKDLKIAQAANPGNKEFQYEEKNVKSMWRVLDAYATSIDSDFMSYGTFGPWMNKLRGIPLNPSDEEILEQFHEYCCTVEGNGDNNGRNDE